MQALDTVITWTLYVSAAIGGIAFVKDDIIWWWYRIKAKRSLKRKLMGRKPADALDKHIILLLAATMDGKMTVFQFKFVTAAIFGFVFTLSSKVLDPMSGVAYGLMLACMPYILLRINHKSMQTKGSNEAEQLVNHLINEYKLTGRNMEEAISRTIVKCKGIPKSRKLLAAMLFKVRETRDYGKIKGCTDVFAYGIGTNWSAQLAFNMYIAITKGTDVSSSLDDILNNIKNARKLLEQRKQNNSEGIKLAEFATPILYVIFFAVAVSLMSISPGTLIYRQTATPEGLKMLVAMSAMFVFNYALIKLSKGKKFDF